MEDFFRLNANINAMQGALPIRVAHHKTLDAPNNHVLHINNYIEIYVYVSGNHNYIVENSVYELKRGDVVIINPLEVHKALPLSKGPYERFYFLVDAHTFDAMCINPLAAFLGKTLKFALALACAFYVLPWIGNVLPEGFVLIHDLLAIMNSLMNP